MIATARAAASTIVGALARRWPLPAEAFLAGGVRGSAAGGVAAGPAHPTSSAPGPPPGAEGAAATAAAAAPGPASPMAGPGATHRPDGVLDTRAHRLSLRPGTDLHNPP